MADRARSPDQARPSDGNTLDLRVVTPTGVAMALRVTRIVAQGPDGSFGILPHHVDHASALVPAVLVCTDADGVEHVLGINEGTLVKCGREVVIATRDAIEGRDLETLEHRVRAAFLREDEQQRTARTALARLEAGMVRRFIDLGKDGL